MPTWGKRRWLLSLLAGRQCQGCQGSTGVKGLREEEARARVQKVWAQAFSQTPSPLPWL